jgi:hypothetical protein
MHGKSVPWSGGEQSVWSDRRNPSHASARSGPSNVTIAGTQIAWIQNYACSVHTWRHVGLGMQCISLDCLHSKSSFVSCDRLFTQVLLNKQCCVSYHVHIFQLKALQTVQSLHYAHISWWARIVYSNGCLNWCTENMESMYLCMKSSACALECSQMCALKCEYVHCIAWTWVHSNYFFLFPSTAPDFGVLQMQFKCPLKKMCARKLIDFWWCQIS